ncbi:MAG: PAS domain S-box protein [Bacteroidota bacterium]
MENRLPYQEGPGAGTLKALSAADVLAGVIKSALDGIVVFKTIFDAEEGLQDFECVLLNPVAEQILGRSSQELIGRSLKQEWPFIHQDGLFENYCWVMETGQPFHYDFYYSHQGLAQWYHLAVVKINNGLVINFSPTADNQQNDTHLRNNREATQLAEILPHLIWQTNADGLSTFFNNQWYAFTALSFAESKGDGWLRLLHPDDAQHTRDIWQNSLQSGQPFEVEFRLRRADRQYRWFLSRVIPVRNKREEITQWVGTATDIQEQKQVEEELRQSKTRELASHLASEAAHLNLEAVLSRLDEGLVMLDNEYRLTYVNYKALEFSGKTWDQVKGKRIWEIVPNLENSDFHQVLLKVATERATHIVDLFRIFKGTWYEIRVYPAHQGIIFFFRDITHRKHAEQAVRRSEEKFRFMTEFIPQIVWTANPDGQLDYYSGRWMEYTGLTLQESMGKGWYTSLHPDDYQATIDSWDKAREATKEYKIEHRLRHKEGEYRWFQTHALPLRDAKGKIIKWFGTATDIESERQNLEMLNSMKEELSRKNEELSRINVDLDTFVYTASHDLRAPINTLQGLMAMFTRKLDGVLDEGDDKLLGLIDISITKLLGVIHDLSEISKIQKDLESEKESVDIRELLIDIQSDLTPIIIESGVQITADFQVDSVLYARKNVRTILYNLLSNAIKYRSRTRPAQVHLATRIEHNNLVLSVSDNGLGLSPIQLSKLFSLFKRFHNHTEGSGIGLYMIKRIVENNGGRIEVDSVEGQGTTFTVYFTLNNEQ